MAGAPDMSSQAFWNEFMRRPDAKKAYQAERRLQDRKRAWAEEREFLDTMAERRKTLNAALENAPTEMKKLISPMFHIRMVQQFLWMIYDECVNNKKGDFFQKLRDEDTMLHLQKLRQSFHDGGEEAMEELEKKWLQTCHAVADDEEKKKEKKPTPVDIHTLKHVLEFGQECKREGNEKFKEGNYEEALFIYTQGDEMLKKWTVEKHLKNEHKWLQDYHLACLKNKSQAALKLEKFSIALEAAEAALNIDDEDHKAWYRKVQALKGMGRFDDAEAALDKLEDVAQWCPDRVRILRDSEQERKRIKYQRLKHKQGTKDMLHKAFNKGVFSDEREEKEQKPAIQDEEPKQMIEPMRPLERTIKLTPALAGDLVDELTDSYGQRWFQERVQKCARDSGYERRIFLLRLRDIAFEVQKPILEKWGFDGTEHGVREMTAALRDHTSGESAQKWLQDKSNACLEKLYGGKEGGMLEQLMGT